MIIRISGLPGSGKTTVGEGLSKELDYELFRIDKYRDTKRDEFKSLISLFEDMMLIKDNFILDSTGFNKRILWVFQFLKARVVDIKLVCDKDILLERVRQKEVPENEYFPYKDLKRYDYIVDYFEDMVHKKCDIEIDTSHISPKVAVKTALNDLNFYKEEGK